EVFTRNGYGQSRFSGSDRIYIENTEPQIRNFTIEGGAPFIRYNRVVLEMSLSDDLSGLDGMCFSNDGEIWSEWEECGSAKEWMLTEGDGKRTVFIKVRDIAGNCAVDNRSILVDSTGPGAESVQFEILGAEGDNGWYLSDVSVTLNTEDPDVSRIIYGTSMGKGGDYEEPIFFHADGIHTLCFYSIDQIGNIGEKNEVTIKIDRSAPVVGSFGIENDPELTNSKEVDLSIQAWDNNSGLSSMCFSRNLTEWEEWMEYISIYHYFLGEQDGDKSIYLRIKDKAGNVRTYPHPAEIEMDTIRPILLGFWPDEGSRVGKDAVISLYFSEAVLENSLKITLTREGGGIVEHEMNMAQDGSVDISAPLRGYASYSLKLDGGVSDLAGNLMGNSIQFQFNVKGEPPGSPRNLTAVIDEEDVLLSWSEPLHPGDAQILNYRIFRQQGGASWSVIGETPGTRFIDISVVGGEVYNYRIAAYNGFEDGEISGVVSVTIPFEPADEDDDDAGDDDGLRSEDKGFELPMEIIMAVSVAVILLALAVVLISSKRRNPPEFEE
ncbi:MAG: Ig-like domain-containing protein, partial [Thermoplasmatota archaeon]